MTDLQHEPVVQPEPTGPTSRTTWWLAAALALAVAALVALGTWVYLDHRASADEQAAWSAVTAFYDANNAHDAAAMKAAVTDGFVWSGILGGNVADGPDDIDAYIDRVTKTVGPNFHIETTGPAVMQGPGEIAVPSRITAPDLAMDSTGITVMRLARADGQLKVSEVYWLP